MLNRHNHSLRIGVSRTGITLLKTSGWVRRRTALLSDHVELKDNRLSTERLAAQLDTALTESGCGNLTATVILTDDWARLFMVTPPKNANRLHDCRAAAEMRFQTLYGEPLTAWKLEADWDAEHPFLACALPKALLDSMHRVATNHGLTLIGLMPQFIAAWNRWRRSLKTNAWFGVVHQEVLTLGAIDRSGVRAVRVTPITADSWQDKLWLEEHVTREALRLNLPMPEQIQVSGALPVHWITQTMGSLICTRLDTTQHVLDTGADSAGVALARCGMTP